MDANLLSVTILFDKFGARPWTKGFRPAHVSVVLSKQVNKLERTLWNSKNKWFNRKRFWIRSSDVFDDAQHQRIHDLYFKDHVKMRPLAGRVVHDHPHGSQIYMKCVRASNLDETNSTSEPSSGHLRLNDNICLSGISRYWSSIFDVKDGNH